MSLNIARPSDAASIRSNPQADKPEQRADSPMREDSTDLRNDSPADVHRSHAPIVPQSDSNASGFTAVNGDNRRVAPFLPMDTTKSITSANAASPSDTIVVSTQFHSHGWRPSIESVPEKRFDSKPHDKSTSNKRKRTSRSPEPGADHDNQQRAINGDGRESPKRRQLTALLDSAVDLTSPDEESRSEPMALSSRLPERLPTTSRERTPINRANQKEPPPKPRPETEASLAESVLKFQQSQQASETRQVQAATTEKAFSPQEEEEQQELQPDDDDQLQDDNLDPKKRKRNFSNRTKTGCHTCRQRKKKCDEAKPTCNNCSRGGFDCGGYGPKPPGQKPSSQSRTVVPLQSKVMYEPAHAPTSYWPHPPDDGATVQSLGSFTS